MMTKDEVLNMDGHEPPVMLADGHMGLLIGYPFEHREECLIQVPGETEARRIHPSKLNRQGDALWEDGAVLPDMRMSYDEWQKQVAASKAAKD